MRRALVLMLLVCVAFPLPDAHADLGVPAMTISVHDLAAVGQPTTVWGRLQIRTSEVTGSMWVAEIPVQLSADGVVVAHTVTDTNGVYIFSYTPPTRGPHVVQVQMFRGQIYGESSPTATIHGVVPPSAPDVGARPGYPWNRALVDVGFSGDDGGAPITRVDIRRLDAGGAWTSVGNMSALGEFNDTVAPDADVRYQVTVSNLAGAGPATEIAFHTQPVAPTDWATLSVVKHHLCEGAAPNFGACTDNEGMDTYGWTASGLLLVNGRVLAQGVPPPAHAVQLRFDGSMSYSCEGMYPGPWTCPTEGVAKSMTINATADANGYVWAWTGSRSWNLLGETLHKLTMTATMIDGPASATTGTRSGWIDTPPQQTPCWVTFNCGIGGVD